jgi:hypothetical protein
MFVNDHQTSLFQAHYSSIWIGSCSSDFIPDMMRLTGLQIAADRIHADLYVPQRYTTTFISNVEKNKTISVLASSVHSFEAYQLKGQYLGSRPCNAEEEQLQQAYVRGFAQTLQQLGLRNGLNFRKYYQDPSLAIRMKIEALFEQTPKSGTGNKLQ